MALQAGAGRALLGLPEMPQTSDGTSLAARVLLLDDGSTRLALVSLTVICLRRQEADRVRAAVAEAAGVAPDRVVIACTHVHSGPGIVFHGEPAAREEACGHLCRAASAAATQAAKLRPARIGFAADHLPGISRVRRILRRDGSIITLRRAWPQYWGWATDPETVGPEEPLDDLLTVLRVETLEGVALAALMHFTSHPIPDFFGYAADLVEQSPEHPVCLPLNGCQGTVDAPFEVPMRGRTQAEQLPILGGALAYRTLELLTRAETSRTAALGMTSREVFLPFDSRVLAAPGFRAALWPEALQAGGFRTLLQALRLGDHALVTIPGEAQVGFSGALAQVAGFPMTRAIGVANDECGYMLWPESRARGGYEADTEGWCVTSEEALGILLASAEEALAELRG